MLDTKVPHGLSGVSLLATIKLFLEKTDASSRTSALTVILHWLEQMKSLTTISETGFLGLVRPWLLLREAEKQFAICAPHLLPVTHRYNYDPSLERALEISLITLRVHEFAELLASNVSSEDVLCLSGLEIRPKPVTDDGLIVLGALTSLFANLIGSRTIELEQSFQGLATEQEVLAFLSAVWKRPIVSYEYTPQCVIIAKDEAGNQYQTGDYDDIPF